METLVQDLRFAARMLFKNPGFAFVAVLALALGIGANTAIFSVVNAVLLRPLPYKYPNRLTVLWANNTREGNPRSPVAAANYVDFKERNQSFEQVGAYLSFNPAMTMTGGSEPKRVTQSTVSPNLFSMLGAETLVGRAFIPEEGQMGQDMVVILSYGLWQREFGGDPGVVGRTLSLNGNNYAIVGVMKPGFYFLSRDVDLWLPLSFNTRYNPNFYITNRSPQGALGVLAKLKPGISFEKARAEMDTIAGQLESQYPETNAGIGATLVPLHEQITEEIRPALLVLLGAVGFVLLIACANVATLLLARARSREKEIAIRAALGAGRLRLMRQLLTESLMLAISGGALGLLMAFWGVRLILSFSPEDIPRQDEIGVDGMVLVFTLGVSLLTGIIFGLIPALQASKIGLQQSLKDGGRSSASPARHRVRNLLVISEIALTLVLLIGAGLLVRSFFRLMDVNPGFEPDRLLTMEIAVPVSQSGSAAQRDAYYKELFQRIEAIPGVLSAGTVTRLPLTARGVTTALTIEGRPVEAGEGPEVEFRRASANYFRAMGIPLLKGRFFTEEDNFTSPGVIILNDSAARRFWPDEDPIGKRVKWLPGPDAPWNTIVGIVGDVKHFGLDSDARPELYISSEQTPPTAPLMVARTDSDSPGVAATIRAQVRDMNKDQPVSAITEMNEIVSASVAGRRFNMILIGLFSSVALVLSAVGIYGVMSYSVTQRTHELGIRMALGARRVDVLKLVVGQGMLLALAGVAIGVISSFALTRLIESLLFGVSATDLTTFIAISALLTGVAFVASFIPARRATRVDPMESLRYE